MPDGTVTEYKYDPFGRRVEETVTAGGVTSITHNLYDGPNILNEYDGNGLLQVSYVHNLGIDDPLSIEKNGGIYYYHKDGLGSVTALTDSTGSKVQSYEYDSFGNLLSQTGTLTQPYTYTGREYDPETGLYYYRARYYDAKLGRFISKDPIGFAGGDVNVYGYVYNNSLNFIDPYGNTGVIVNPVFIGLVGLTVAVVYMESPAGQKALSDIYKKIQNITEPVKNDFFKNKDIDENTDMTDPSTWPVPPAEGECKVGEPSRTKPRERGEKSLWDPQGGEWRPHKPNDYHPEGHWDYKSPGGRWQNIPVK